MKCSLFRWFTFVLFVAAVAFGSQSIRAEDPKDKPADGKKADEKKADTKKSDETKKADDQKTDEDKKKVDDAKKAAEKKKVDDAKKAATEKKKADDAKKIEESKKKIDEAKKAIEKKKDDAPKDNAKKLEDAKKKAEENAKRLEEAKKRNDELVKKQKEDAEKRKAEQEEAKKRAEAAKKLDDLPKSQDGFGLLFNGKDFTNWRIGQDFRSTYLDGKTEAADKHYVANKDVLVVDAGEAKAGQHISELRSVKELNKLFQIKFEFRAVEDGKATFNFGGQPIELRDYTKISKRFGAAKLKNFKSGEWNEIEITLQYGTFKGSIDRKQLTEKDVVELTFKDGKIELKVNGKTADATSFHIDRNSPTAAVTCNGEELSKGTLFGHFGQGLRGQVSVAANRGKVEIRNLRVKEVQ